MEWTSKVAGRYIQGTLLEDEESNAFPVGVSSQDGDTFTFTIGINPDGSLGKAIVRISVELVG